MRQVRIAGLVLVAAVGLMGFGAVCEGQIPMQGPAPHGMPGPQSDAMQQTMMDQMAKAGPLKIVFGDKSAEWTKETLAVLPHVTVTVHNEHTKADETYSGVLLIDLLAKLGVPDKPRGKQFRMYVVAEGADGYGVVYSLGEVAPDVHDATVMVADSEDGKAIAADGPLKMVSTGEKRPARWVRNLATIKVMTAQ